MRLWEAKTSPMRKIRERLLITPPPPLHLEVPAFPFLEGVLGRLAQRAGRGLTAASLVDRATAELSARRLTTTRSLCPELAQLALGCRLAFSASSSSPSSASVSASALAAAAAAAAGAGVASRESLAADRLLFDALCAAAAISKTSCGHASFGFSLVAAQVRWPGPLCPALCGPALLASLLLGEDEDEDEDGVQRGEDGGKDEAGQGRDAKDDDDDKEREPHEGPPAPRLNWPAFRAYLAALRSRCGRMADVDEAARLQFSWVRPEAGERGIAREPRCQNRTESLMGSGHYSPLLLTTRALYYTTPRARRWLRPNHKPRFVEYPLDGDTVLSPARNILDRGILVTVVVPAAAPAPAPAEITGPLRARLLVAGSVARGLFEWDSPVRSAASLSAALAVVWAGLVPYVVPGGVVLLVALLLLLRRHRHAPGSFAVAAPVRPRRPNPIARIRRIRQNIHKARDTLQAGNEVLLRVYALVNWESSWHSKVVVCYLTAVGSFLLVMPWRIILTLLVAHCYTYRT
eukprot:g3294.t1